MPAQAGQPNNSCGSAALSYVEGEVRLAYIDHGQPGGHPVLLVGGTDQQIIEWPAQLILQLQQKGYRPIRYDPRDVGCSTHLEKAGAPDWGKIFGALMSGAQPQVPYSLNDLAADALRILDTLSIDRAYIVAASGGTATAAELSSKSPDRIAGLVLLMPASGDPTIPIPADPAKMGTVPPPPASQAPTEEVVAYRVALGLALEGAEFRRAEEEIQHQAILATDRDWDPDGIARSGAAILAAGDLRRLFKQVSAPTVVLHGLDDPLISPAHGQTVAATVPGAHFEGIAGLGHSFPPMLASKVVDALERVRAAGQEARK
nr:alpha/beta hydrolase [Qipengyuania proteolytica]